MEFASLKECLERIDRDFLNVSLDKSELYKVVRGGFDTFDGQNSSELLWRMCRAAWEVAATAGMARDTVKQMESLAEAEEWGKKTLELDPNQPKAHQWLANIYGKMSHLLGTNDRIAMARKVQYHLDILLKGFPDCFMALYTYGRWYFEMAKLTPLEKKIVTATFDSPLEATFEDAIEKFQKVKQQKPEWRANYFWLGKSYARAENYSEASKAFELAMAAPLIVGDVESKLIEEELQSLHKKYASAN